MSLTASVPETAAVLIPPFIKPDPALWFHMIESTFELATPKPISESKTKYNYVVAHLPPETATTVRDIIMKPDTSDPYQQLKLKIIERCSESKTQEIRRLLTGQVLGDRKPTELLRDLKRRAENHSIADSLLLELFIQAMPVPVQTVLASISPLTPEKAAEVADRIMEITSVNIPSVCSTSDSPSISADKSTNSTTDTLLREVQKLRKEVADLRSRSPFRHNYSNRQRSKSRDKKMCWYHSKFGEKAQKCSQPCSFQGNDLRKE